MVRGPQRGDAALGRFAWGPIVLAALVTALVTISSIGALPGGARLAIGQFFPEGWELFTAGPQAARFRPAVSSAGHWQDASRLPLAEPSNAFGFDRTPRWQSVELTRLVEEVPRLDKWTRCERRPFRCLARVERRRRVWHVPNRTPYQSLCGRVGLIRQLIAPLGVDAPPGRLTTTHVIVLEVRC